MDKLDLLAFKMAEYDQDAGRIQHFLKVRAFCHLIAVGEGMPESERNTLEAAALIHDIGIKAALEKYGHQNGKLQEELGPPLAHLMLEQLEFDEQTIERICYLVGHHHTLLNVDGLDYRILLEADWLVNNYEYGLKNREIYASYQAVFQTETGKKLFKDSFGPSAQT